MESSLFISDVSEQMKQGLENNNFVAFHFQMNNTDWWNDLKLLTDKDLFS